MRRARPGTRSGPTPAKPGGLGGVVAPIAFALGLVVAFAGCFADKGLGIEVDIGDTHASKVELYLGKAACSPDDNAAGIDCTSIAPPDGTIALRGNIWFRDSPLSY